MSDDLLPLSPEGMDYLLRNHGDVRGTAQYRCREDASKVWPLPETEHARDEAPHQESQARGDEADDGRVEVGEAAQRLEDRPEGHVPEAGGSDRPITIRAEQPGIVVEDFEVIYGSDEAIALHARLEEEQRQRREEAEAK